MELFAVFLGGFVLGGTAAIAGMAVYVQKVARGVDSVLGSGRGAFGEKPSLPNNIRRRG